MKLALPEVQLILRIGGGDFSMNAQKIETAVRANVPIRLIIYSDKSFGALRTLQKRHYGDHQLGSEYGETAFVKLAEANVAVGLRVDDPKDLEPTVVSGHASNEEMSTDARIAPWKIAHRSGYFKEFHKF